MTSVHFRPSCTVVLLSFALVASGCAAGGGAEATAAAPAAPVPAPTADRPTTLAGGVFTADQASQGGELFGSICAECHASREFVGSDFFFNWEGSNVGRFLQVVSETMPEDNPGGLSTEQYLAVTAYVLELNEYPAGSSPLAHDEEYLATLRFEREAGER